MTLGLNLKETACAKILLDRIRTSHEFDKDIGGAIISYKDLCIESMEKYGLQIDYHFELGYVIGDINHWCIENIDSKAPLISVLVGSVENNYEPGNGFWGLYENVRGTLVERDMREVHWIKELDYVYQYDWREIAKRVDEIAKARGI